VNEVRVSVKIRLGNVRVTHERVQDHDIWVNLLRCFPGPRRPACKNRVRLGLGLGLEIGSGIGIRV